MSDNAGWVTIAVTVALVILALIGWGVYSGHDSREKHLQQFNTCVESGGTYVKTYGGEPLCLHGVTVGNSQ